MNQHQDTLDDLNKNLPLSEKLNFIHSVLKQRHDFIDRIAVALYDSKTDLLKTFISSSGSDQPLIHYQAKLSEANSLQQILREKKPRVIQDLSVMEQGDKEHTKKIASQGYKASYTLPMYSNGNFFGFIFYNSYNSHPFEAQVLHDLDITGHLITLTIVNELTAIRTLVATVQAARDIAKFRDLETAAHLDRMSRYARLIAQEIAPLHQLDDEYIEHVFLFAPLHDIGKIGVPDAILKKADGLTAEEFKVMQTHVEKGRDIIDAMLRDFDLGTFQYIDMLRNIAEYHHEAMDGSGYPKGISGEAIPIEARIIAVADVFDALTSQRPYKERWSNEDAFAMLEKLAGVKLDRDCVAAMLRNREAVEQIQARFLEDPFG